MTSGCEPPSWPIICNNCLIDLNYGYSNNKRRGLRENNKKRRRLFGIQMDKTHVCGTAGWLAAAYNNNKKNARYGHGPPSAYSHIIHATS